MEAPMALISHGKPGPSSPANSVQHFDGRQLAYALRGKSAAARATLAVTCGVGVGLYHPTDKQLAALFRVAVFQLAQARNGNKKRNGNGKHKNGETLAEHLVNATPAERVEAARVLGVDQVWDQMVLPIITEEKAAAK
jgi:hypothetical protein